jgi:hypothetical protein
MEYAIPQLETLLSPSRIVALPDGGRLIFLKDNLDPSQLEALSRRISVIYQESLGGIPWAGHIFGPIGPGWGLSRIGRHGKHLERMPYINCSSLIDARPFEMTLWLGSKPTKRVKQSLVDLVTRWAGFSYPDHTSEEPAIEILDITFQERAATVQADIRAHQGFALATLISMLDLFSLKRARIKTLVLGQIEDLNSLLAKAGQ